MGRKLLILVSLFAMLLSACGQTKVADTQKVDLTQPVTLKVLLMGAYVDVFHKYMDPLLKERFPNITLDYLDPSTNLKDLVSSGDIPDIIMQNTGIREAMSYNLQSDLTGLIKKYNFDLSTIDQALLKSVKAYGTNGELFALPSDRSVQVLLYNKDIFDKFGVLYPKDGMTWNDLINLNKKLTRNDGNDGTTQYYGFNMGGPGQLKSELGLHYFGSDGKANITTSDWQKAAATWKSIYEIPGAIPPGGNTRDQFTKNRNVAMIINNSSWLLRNPIPDLNWDYVTAPTFDNHLIPDTLGAMLLITSSCKNKDFAFQVLSLYFSDQIQTEIARDAALVTISTNPGIQKQYGANIPANANKNVLADFKGQAAVKVVEDNDNLVGGIFNSEFSDIASGKKDINTALREGEGLANQAVQKNAQTGQ